MPQRPLVVFVFSLAAMLAASPAAALTDRAHLVKWCSNSSWVAAGRCIGYLLATEDALSGGPVEGVSACLPADVSLQQLHKTALDWLNAHPQAESPTALGLVARAYAQQYPCGTAP